jgi:hypothetical protein
LDKGNLKKRELLQQPEAEASYSKCLYLNKRVAKDIFDAAQIK